MDSKTQSYCAKIKDRDCFNCSKVSDGKCEWRENSCKPRISNKYSPDINQWQEYVDACEDSENICERKLILKSDTDNVSRIWKMRMKVPYNGIINKNYYCHFNLELNRDYLYTIEVDRFKSKDQGASLNENVEF